MKWIGSIFFLSLLLNTNGICQTSIDSLEKLLGVQKGVERVHTLYALTRAYYSIDLQTNRFYAAQTLEHARKIGYKPGMILGAQKLGGALLQLGEYEAGARLLSQCFDGQPGRK